MNWPISWKAVGSQTDGLVAHWSIQVHSSQSSSRRRLRMDGARRLPTSPIRIPRENKSKTKKIVHEMVVYRESANLIWYISEKSIQCLIETDFNVVVCIKKFVMFLVVKLQCRIDVGWMNKVNPGIRWGVGLHLHVEAVKEASLFNRMSNVEGRTRT